MLEAWCGSCDREQQWEEEEWDDDYGICVRCSGKIHPKCQVNAAKNVRVSATTTGSTGTVGDVVPSVNPKGWELAERCEIRKNQPISVQYTEVAPKLKLRPLQTRPV